MRDTGYAAASVANRHDVRAGTRSRRQAPSGQLSVSLAVKTSACGKRDTGARCAARGGLAEQAWLLHQVPAVMIVDS